MGLLWKTEGTRRIVETLNRAFDGGTNQGLDYIRKNAGSKILKKIAKGNWQPGHLARMLQLYPYDQSAAANAISVDDRKRWHYFLRTVVGGDDTVFKPLRSALADAITSVDSNKKFLVAQVSFAHVEVPNITPYLVIFDVPGTGGLVRHITLFTAALDSNPGEDFDPPDPNDEEDFPGAAPGRPPWKTSA